MDFGLSGRTAFLLGESTSTTNACARELQSEGVRVASFDDADRADIVVAFAHVRAGSNAVEATLEDLYVSWDRVVDAVAAYRRALPHMRLQQWGRFVWVGSAASRSLDADEDDLNVVATLGVRALHKVIAVDEGPANILANTVLRGTDVTDQDVADAVAFLCSQGAGYLTGVTLTVDGGTGSAVF
jgi:3-oxoacyl-[acyl-carrier protein] reductase